MAVVAAGILLSFGGLARAAEPPIELSGVMMTGGQVRVALTDKASSTTRWVEPGKDFLGYTVIRYDPGEEAVLVRRGTQEFRLSLVTAQTSPAPAASNAMAAAPAPLPSHPTPAASPETAANAIRANLRLLAAAARRVQQERPGVTLTYSDLVGPGKPIRELAPVAGEDYRTLAIPPNAPVLSVTTANGHTVALDLNNTPQAVAGAAAASTAPAATGTAVPPSAPSSVSVGIATTPAPAPRAPAAETPDSAPPTPTGRPSALPTYTAQSGDTWERISTATGVPVPQLKQLNPQLADTPAPPPGQSIRVR